MFTPSDAALVVSKMTALLASGERRQQEQLEHMTFGEYLSTRQLSPEARKLARFPELGGIADADGISARAVARLLCLSVGVLVGKPGQGLERGLSLIDGPETEAWFDPWARYLESIGTRFHLGEMVTGFTHADGRITGATVRTASGEQVPISADWYVLAVPHDRAAALMSETLIAADPAFRNIARIPLVRGFAMQIFLKQKATGLGTLFVNPSAPWDTGSEVLSSAWRIDLADFGDGQATECVSVQFTDASWTSLPGGLHGKPAKDCSRDEIIEEVLAQLRRYLPRGEEIFAAHAIHSIHINPNHTLAEDGQLSIDEPMFASAPSNWTNQPDSVTAIPNFFLAGSYTRTIATVDSMDAANESGKRAANGVLAVSNSSAQPVRIAKFRPPRWLKPLWALDDRRYTRGLPNLFDIVAPARPTMNDRELVKETAQ